MRLFEKYNRLNIAATILTFVIGSCAFYFALSYILISEVDEDLGAEQQEIVTYVKLHNTLPEIILTKEEHTEYALSQPGDSKPGTCILTVKGKFDTEEENYREIQFGVEVSGKTYAVKVDKPLEQTETLLQAIIVVTIAMIAMILLAGYLINRTVIRRLWKPFYKTIDTVKAYQLTDNGILRLDKADIDEFSLLNNSINDMMERIHHDFSALKNFTGQAAHEMQTPLAVIRSRIDMLMQDEVLLEKNAQGIADIERSVQRLSRLHQSLLLLTKVENRQFVLNEPVQLDQVIVEKCAEYAERAEAMQLTIHMELAPMAILFHSHLADILVNNLLNNAMRYNMSGGTIDVELRDKELSISNTSADGMLDSGKLFKRFYCGSTAQDGTGLGLSIVKQICELAGYAISYKYSDGKHTFIVSFS